MHRPAAPVSREECYACRRPKKHCLCGSTKAFPTRTRFVILMHEEEARRQRTGTGRLARMCLANSELLVGIDFTDSRRVNELLGDPAYMPFVLYPGPQAVNFGKIAGELLPRGKSPLVFVLDGTWRTARSILNRSLNLRELPRLSFSGSYRSCFSIKRQPREYCVSTIEAIYHLCCEAEAAGFEKLEGRSGVLMDILGKIVDTQMHYRKNVGRRREENRKKGR